MPQDDSPPDGRRPRGFAGGLGPHNRLVGHRNQAGRKQHGKERQQDDGFVHGLLLATKFPGVGAQQQPGGWRGASDAEALFTKTQRESSANHLWLEKLRTSGRDLPPGQTAKRIRKSSFQVIRTIWPVVLAALTARGFGNMHIVRLCGTTLHPRSTQKEYHSFPDVGEKIVTMAASHPPFDSPQGYLLQLASALLVHAAWAFLDGREMMPFSPSFRRHTADFVTFALKLLAGLLIFGNFLLQRAIHSR